MPVFYWKSCKQIERGILSRTRTRCRRRATLVQLWPALRSCYSWRSRCTTGTRRRGTTATRCTPGPHSRQSNHCFTLSNGTANHTVRFHTVQKFWVHFVTFFVVGVSDAAGQAFGRVISLDNALEVWRLVCLAVTCARVHQALEAGHVGYVWHGCSGEP